MFQRFQRDLQRMMIGRYGNDELNTTLFGLSLGVWILSWFIRSWILSNLYALLILIVILRSWSKNIPQRKNENRAYLKLIWPIRSRLSVFSLNRKDRSHKYYVCPQCNAKVRIPSGHGKVSVTCPHCRHVFTKRS